MVIALQNTTATSRHLRVLPPSTPYFSLGLGELGPAVVWTASKLRVRPAPSSWPIWPSDDHPSAPAACVLHLGLRQSLGASPSAGSLPALPSSEVSLSHSSSLSGHLPPGSGSAISSPVTPSHKPLQWCPVSQCFSKEQFSVSPQLRNLKWLCCCPQNQF